MIEFLNSLGEQEISLEERARREEIVPFIVLVRHPPFYAELALEYSIFELQQLSGYLQTMLFELKESTFVFSSLGREMLISLQMSNTGHIEAEVFINAGTRGYMKYRFDFDQSFLQRLIEQVNNVIKINSYGNHPK